MDVADTIKTILNGLVDARTVRRVTQVAADLEQQLAAVVAENQKLHAAYTRQENRYTSLQDQVRHAAMELLEATMPEGGE